MNYRREIDGIRALAVLPVIFFHAGFENFSGGFVGVDVFFVISGYLITTVILDELELGKFSIVNFYERRARRILPALFLVMLVCIPFAWFLLLPSDMKDFSKSLVAVSVFLSNILFWRESGYFDTAAELKPLLHTWSLAVEEQYYVLFPLFLMFGWKLGRRWILLFLGLLFATSLAVAQWATYAKPNAAFYLLPTRGWELLIGAFAAFYLSKANRLEFSQATREVGGWLGFALIFYAVFLYNKATPFPGLYALVPTVGALLIILFATQETIVGKFVGNKVFVFVGVISYSAYLWHQPLLAFAKVYTFNQLDIKLASAAIILSLVLAFLSFKFVETPFRSNGKINRGNIFALSFLGTVFFILIGVTSYIKDGFNENYKLINQAIDNWDHPGNLYKTNIDGYYKYEINKPIDVLFFGDSHAEQFAPLSSEMAAAGLNVGFLTGGGCPPIPKLLDDLHQHCSDLFDRLSQVLNVESSIRNVVVAGCFNCYFIEQSLSTPIPGDKYNYYYLTDSQKLYFRNGKGQVEALNSLKNFLNTISFRFNVTLVGDNPLADSFNPSVILSYMSRGDSKFFKSRYPNFNPDEFGILYEQFMLDDKLRALTSSEVNYISLIDIVCPNGICKALGKKGDPLYKDGSHMRPDFVKKVVGMHLMKYMK